MASNVFLRASVRRVKVNL